LAAIPIGVFIVGIAVAAHSAIILANSFNHCWPKSQTAPNVGGVGVGSLRRMNPKSGEGRK